MSYNIIDDIIPTEATRKNVRAMLPVLVYWAKTGQTNHTYGDLTRAIGKTKFSGIGYSLYAIQTVLNELSDITGRYIPTLNSLAKNSKTRIPSEGFEFVSKTYNDQDYNGKLTFVEGLDSKATKYQYWDWVLKKLDLLPYDPFSDEELDYIKSTKGEYNGGEGEEHKRLKEYILSNPDTIGIKNVITAKNEYFLPSGDKLDVYFELKNGNRIAVEVKPSISDDADIIRGVFQCIKYKSVMDALRQIENLNYNTTVIYLTARPISDMHQRLIATLEINHIFLDRKI